MTNPLDTSLLDGPVTGDHRVAGHGRVVVTGRCDPC